MRNAILLAGGFGTRLAPVTGGLPKPLVEVAGRPFIEHVLDLVVSSGCTEIIMAVGYRWEMLRDHLGNRYNGANLNWSVESEPAGTGGAIRLGFEAFNLNSALVLNADTFFRADLSELERLHYTSCGQVTVALRAVEDVSRFGAVAVDGEHRIVAFREKGENGPGLVNGGVYIIERSIFNLRHFPYAFSFERDLLQSELAQIRPLGVPSTAYFIDIGIPEDLERARNEMTQHK